MPGRNAGAASSLNHVAVVLAVVLAAAVAAVSDAVPAFACSSPDSDAVYDSPLIIGGRISSWRELPEGGTGSFTAISVEVAVDHVYKGRAPVVVTLLDTASLQKTESRTYWLGSSGACGSFNADPLGQYIVIGLASLESGRYRASLPNVIFIGPEPGGPAYAQALKRLAVLPPPAGSGGPSSDPGGALAAVALGAAFLLAAACMTAFATRRR